jgi:hypothetical protein
MALDIDYTRYGAGEAQLAWLDEEISLALLAGKERAGLIAVIEAIIGAIREQHAPVGHVKFLIRGQNIEHKISFVTLDEPDCLQHIPPILDSRLTLLVNARVEIEAATLRQIVKHAIEKVAGQEKISYAESEVSFFHPDLPRPTHRLI